MVTGRHARESQRGQALFETAISLPLLLLGLFGVIWAIQSGVQYERIEGAVRYAGLVSRAFNPYTDYSLYSVYGQLGVTIAPPAACATPIPSAVSDGAPFASSQTVTASPPFWHPSANPSTNCANNGGYFGVEGSPAGTPDGSNVQVEDYLFSATQPSITSTVAVPTFLSHVLGTSTSSASTGEWFWRGPTVQQIMFCYQEIYGATTPSLYELATKSLKYATDQSVAATATPMPSTVSAVAMPFSSDCIY
jgi:hypothetical protein